MEKGGNAPDCVANLLTHALAALAIHAGAWSWASGQPLMPLSFGSALIAILPDIDLGERGQRTPYGHSLVYSLLWILVAHFAFAVTVLGGLTSIESIWPYTGAVIIGIGSHVLLDAVTGPGIFVLPQEDGWTRLRLNSGKARDNVLEPAISTVSVGALLLLLATL